MSRKCHSKFPHTTQIIGKWKTSLARQGTARQICFENATLLKEEICLLQLEFCTVQDNLRPTKVAPFLLTF